MPTMRRCALLLVAAGCATPCPSTPLAPLDEAPRFVVELTDFGAPGAMGADAGLPDPDPDPDPDPTPAVLPSYAALALYGADGALLHERWLDTYTGWEGAAETFDARDGLPFSQTPGRLTLLLRQRPSVAALALASGNVVHDLVIPAMGSAEADALIDLAPVLDGLSLLTHRDGRLSTLDLRGDGALLRTLDLASIVGAPVRAGRVAPLTGTTRAVVGLDVSDRGLVALVDVAAGAVSLLELPGLRLCVEVAPLPEDPSRPRVARVAVLCLGQPGDASDTRLGAGLALLEASDDTPLSLVAARPASALFPAFPPTHALVGLHGAWVAVASRGSVERPDVLMVLDLASDAGALLWQEDWTERWGPALGEGAFDPASRELVWPSVRSGLLRFQQVGARSDARFDEQPAARTPACSSLAARRVRHLPAPP